MKITQEKLDKILELHMKWCSGKRGGKRANLSRLDLREVDSSGIGWREVDFSEIDCLRRANFSGSDLRGVNFSRSDLRETDFSRSDLRETDFSGTDLRGANLEGTDLRGVDLYRADLEEAILPDYLIVPEKEEFIGWKKLADDKIAKILIFADSQRMNPLGSRKCRTDMFKILEIYNPDGSIYKSKKLLDSWGPYNMKYKKNKIYKTELDADIRVECTNGFHFFLTRQEAEKW